MRRDKPRTVEEARAESIASYRRLVDKMFKNVINDIDVVIDATESMRATAIYVKNDEDKETAEYMLNMLTALRDASDMLKDKYQERFGNPGISDAEWAKLDKAMGEAKDE